MDHNRLSAHFAIKTVGDGGQRLICGHCSVFTTEDRVGDIVDPKAFDKTLAGKSPGDVPIYISHDLKALPVGHAQELYPDRKGLYVAAKVYPTTAGDDLLATAKSLHAVGKSLGLSFGYTVNDHSYERGSSGKTVRRLKAVDLHEISFAGRAIIAHPDAVSLGVKALGREAMSAQERRSIEEENDYYAAQLAWLAGDNGDQLIAWFERYMSR